MCVMQVGVSGEPQEGRDKGKDSRDTGAGVRGESRAGEGKNGWERSGVTATPEGTRLPAVDPTCSANRVIFTD